MKNCFNCKNCIYIGEGNFYCACTTEIALTDWNEPTDDFMACNGKEWEKE